MLEFLSIEMNVMESVEKKNLSQKMVKGRESIERNKSKMKKN